LTYIPKKRPAFFPWLNIGTIVALWPPVLNPASISKFLVFPLIMARPPISWSAVTTIKELELYFKKLSATPMALLN
tara:strand:- start:357 stop:584 length:228 start_codon:yes stop_codon:yes gene_type:complete